MKDAPPPRPAARPAVVLMEAPPLHAPARSFSELIAPHLATEDELKKLRAFEEELKKLLALFDSYHWSKMAEEEEEKRKAFFANPASEAGQEYLKVRFQDKAERRFALEELRKATMARIRNFYGSRALPHLTTIFNRAHAMWSAEMETQKAREEIWRPTWQEWAKWGTHFSQPELAPAFPSITPLIARHLLELHKRIRSLADVPPHHEFRPSAAAVLSELGVDLYPKPLS